MDVFSSALKNPLPPTRKRSDQQRSEADTTLNSLSEASPKYAHTSRDASPLAPASQSASQYGGLTLARDSKKKNLRRRHRNSHLGCGICKKRRIKCDEHLPQCFNCLKGRLHCAYLNLDAPARNALRLAQHNQNLRDEREETVSPKQEEKPAPYVDLALSTHGQPPLYPSVMNTQSETARVYANATGGAEARKLSNMANAAPAVPVPVALSMMQSMYVPMYQLQPVNTGMPYPQMPVQMIAGHQPQPVLYPEQMPMQYSSQHSPGAPQLTLNAPYMCYPAPAHSYNQQYDAHTSSGYLIPMRGQFGHSTLPENGGYYPQTTQNPGIMASVPQGNTPGIPTKSQAAAAPHASPSSSNSPVTSRKSTVAPSVPSLIHPTASANSSEKLSVPYVSLFPVSLGASPLLPPMAGVPDINKNSTIKLAPIESRSEKLRQDPNESDGAARDNEKISSIKMLLS